MLLPKKTKFRKQMRGRLKNDANTGNKISFGSFALQATGRGYLTNRQIESARRVITRSLKRGGKIWIRVFPDKPITKRPAEVRMGKVKALLTVGLCRFTPEGSFMKSRESRKVSPLKPSDWQATNCQ